MNNITVIRKLATIEFKCSRLSDRKRPVSISPRGRGSPGEHVQDSPLLLRSPTKEAPSPKRQRANVKIRHRAPRTWRVGARTSTTTSRQLPHHKRVNYKGDRNSGACVSSRGNRVRQRQDALECWQHAQCTRTLLVCCRRQGCYDCKAGGKDSRLPKTHASHTSYSHAAGGHALSTAKHEASRARASRLPRTRVTHMITTHKLPMQ